MSTFVSVGNATQPFYRLLEAVRANLAALPQPVFVQYGSATNIFGDACAAVAFVDMEEFARRVAAAELLVLHAGAGSIIHAARAGKVPVVMPRQASLREHVDDHQLEFTHELARTQRIVVCEKASELPAAAAGALQLQRRLIDGPAESPMLRMVRQAIGLH